MTDPRRTADRAPRPVRRVRIGSAIGLVTALLLAALGPALEPSPQRAGALSAPAGNPPEAFVIADATSGVILDARGLHTPIQPASMVKLLTALTAVSNLPPDVRVPVSERAARQPVMRIGMPAGQIWPLDDMLASLIMVSANDAAWAIAECSGGSVDGFAEQANALMRRLGATDGTFNDPAGLSDGDSHKGGSTLSMWDLAIIGRNALAVPRIAATAATVRKEFTDAYGAPHTYTNHNRTLLEGYRGANGLKTGFTSDSGRTLIASATRGKRTIIVALAGTWDTTNWAGTLLDRGFATDPDATGTRLPPVRVREITRRAGARAACADGAAPPSSTAPTTATTDAPVRAVGVGTDARAAAADAGGPPWATVALVTGGVLVALTAAIVWRRRVVIGRRRRRADRRRSLERAQRAGTVHVVDASVPTGRVDRQATSRAAETDPGASTRTTRGDR
jgi:D-alanyl-D-alanine carboxypeptidase (penicillin-binding protein 5/6)